MTIKKPCRTFHVNYVGPNVIQKISSYHTDISIILRACNAENRQSSEDNFGTWATTDIHHTSHNEAVPY